MKEDEKRWAGILKIQRGDRLWR